MCFVRMRLLDFPLERDEGEYAYAGQLILEGVPPYQEFYNMKWPGTYLAYAAIMGVCGETPAGIHAGVLCVCLGSALLVFLIGRQIGGEGMGAVAGSAQALLEMNPSMLGLAGHATHFVVLPALAGIWVLMTRWERTGLGRCVAAGVCFGLACMMKQAGAVFGLFGVTWLLWRGVVESGRGMKGLREMWPRLGWLAAGGLIPLLAMAGWLAAAGVWGNFWHWTVEYAWAYVDITTVSKGLEDFESAVGRLWTGAPGLWLAAALGMAVLWWEPALRRWRFFLVVFAVFSFAGVCPGYYFQGHYFLLLVPAAALLCGAAWRAAAAVAGRVLCWLGRASGNGDAAMRGWVGRPGFARGASVAFGAVYLLGAGQSLVAWGDVFFRLTPEEACRRIYYANPFPEAVVAGQHIRENSPPDARIAVLGSEPEIYFYSHRRAATGYIYTYPLMESQPFAAKMRHDMIAEIEAAAPEFLIYVETPTSWDRRPESDATIFDWRRHYCQQQMQLDGVVKILGKSPAGSASPGNPGAGERTAETQFYLAVYKRKAALPGKTPF